MSCARRCQGGAHSQGWCWSRNGAHLHQPVQWALKRVEPQGPDAKLPVGVKAPAARQRVACQHAPPRLAHTTHMTSQVGQQPTQRCLIKALTWFRRPFANPSPHGRTYARPVCTLPHPCTCAHTHAHYHKRAHVHARTPTSGYEVKRFPTWRAPPLLTESDRMLSVTVWSRPPYLPRGNSP